MIFPLALIVISGCSVSKNRKADDPAEKISYTGRTGKDSSGYSKIYWPGTSIKTRFFGTGLRATFQDQRGQNTFYVIIDNDSLYSFKPDSIKKSYTLVSGLPRREHTVEIWKLNDWTRGYTTFFGFQYEPDTKVLNAAPPERHIEFYGNSITVGAGMLEKPGSDPRYLSTNNYYSYGAITARHFNAAYSCVSLSGIGLMISWGSLIMPEMYDRLDPENPDSKWQFTRAEPDIVVVNLLQNDQALFEDTAHNQFKKRFGKQAPSPDSVIHAYRNFIGRLRGHYPNAHIICCLGSMGAVKTGSPWPGYIEQAVTLVNDKKIYTHFFDYINADRHPDIHEHREMAGSLIRFIENNIRW